MTLTRNDKEWLIRLGGLVVWAISGTQKALQFHEAAELEMEAKK